MKSNRGFRWFPSNEFLAYTNWKHQWTPPEGADCMAVTELLKFSTARKFSKPAGFADGLRPERRVVHLGGSALRH